MASMEADVPKKPLMEDTEIEKLKAKAWAAIDEAATELHSLSHKIWSHPELYYAEKHAHQLLTDFLEQKEFHTERSFHLDTAFMATEGDTGCGPNIAVLCEYDALPEIGHGCGHNLIAEVGIAAGVGIKAALHAAETCLGKLTVLGTPAEEAGGGKIDLLQKDVFGDIDIAMMAHPDVRNMVTCTALAMIEVHVKYRGRASHASSAPWDGINALDAAVMAYASISTLRQQLKPSWKVHGIFTKGGAVPNIIPEEAELHFYLRTPTDKELKELIDKAKACFEGAAVSTGCKVEYEWDPKPYKNVITNNTIASLYQENGESLGVTFCSDPISLGVASGSTDMGNVSHVVPGIHPYFSIGAQGSLHTHEFREAAGDPTAQANTLRTAKIIASTAIDIYCKPHLLDNIKKDFKKDLQEQS